MRAVGRNPNQIRVLFHVGWSDSVVHVTTGLLLETKNGTHVTELLPSNTVPIHSRGSLQHLANRWRGDDALSCPGIL